MTDIGMTHMVRIEKQNYILIGKSAKETEIRIVCDGEDFEGDKKRVETMIRLAKLANMYATGQINLPPIEGEKK